MKRLILFAILIVLVCSCSEKPSNPVDVTAKIYVDLLVVKEKYSSSQDSLDFHKNQVFEKYNTSKEQYEKDLSMLGSDNDNWGKFFELSEAYIDTLKKTGSN